MASDPSTLAINGLCVGITSTDVLFHLSARTMFRGCASYILSPLSLHFYLHKSQVPTRHPHYISFHPQRPRGQDGHTCGTCSQTAEVGGASDVDCLGRVDVL